MTETAADLVRRRSGVDHVFLTRFNLPSPGMESLIRAKDGWLLDRVALFERYTLPSMAGQTAPGLRWVVYFDPESPGWLKERIDDWTADGRLTALFAEEVSTERLLADLHRITARVRGADTEDERDLLTTNLDNDDGLAVDFAERLQTAERGSADCVAVWVVNGLITAPGGVFLRTDRRNAFASVRTSWSAARTCWSEWHNLLGETMPVVELGGPPGWLQVVHGANVSNRVRGDLTTASSHRSRFPGLLEDRPDPGVSKIAADRILHGPIRRARDRFRTRAKDIAIRLVGKGGLDRIKLVVTIAKGRVRPPGG